MSDVTAMVARADAALRGGDIAGAERALTPALLVASPSADAMLLMAEVRRLQGRMDDAESLARRAADADPRSGRASGRLGAILQVQSRFDEARAAYEEALKREPSLNAVRLNYVRCLVAMGAFVEAEAEAKILVKRSEGAAAYALLSEALRAQSRAEDALVAADKAVTLAPADHAARIAKARACERSGRAAEAVELYQGVAHSGFRSPDEVLGFVRALTAAGDNEGVEHAIQRALQRWPDHEQLLSAQCRARWTGARAEDGAFAAPMLEALSRNPTNLRLRMAAAELYYRAGRHADAEQLLRGGLLQAPGNAGLLSSLAVLLDTVGRAQEALSLYDRAQSAAPGDEAISANRVAALIRTGRADEALIVIRKLREKRPNAQNLIAREALALRVLDDPGYRRLYDYDRYVKAYTIEPPQGFASLAEFNRDLGQRIRTLHNAAAHPLEQSLRNGTQTNTDLARSSDPVIRSFIEAIEAPIGDYIYRLPNDPDDPVGRRKSNGHRIWGCWSVRLRPGGFHVNHVHPEGWISSSYYVDVPAHETGDDPHAGWIKFGEPDLPIAGCEAELFIEPAPGKLVLFPSYMWHGTVPFTHGERLTAPFDVVPT